MELFNKQRDQYNLKNTNIDIENKPQLTESLINNNHQIEILEDKLLNQIVTIPGNFYHIINLIEQKSMLAFEKDSKNMVRKTEKEVLKELENVSQVKFEVKVNLKRINFDNLHKIIDEKTSLVKLKSEFKDLAVQKPVQNKPVNFESKNSDVEVFHTENNLPTVLKNQERSIIVQNTDKNSLVEIKSQINELLIPEQSNTELMAFKKEIKDLAEFIPEKKELQTVLKEPTDIAIIKEGNTLPALVKNESKSLELMNPKITLPEVIRPQNNHPTVFKKEETQIVPLKNQQTGLMIVGNKEKGLVNFDKIETGLRFIDKTEETSLIDIPVKQTQLVKINNQKTSLSLINQNKNKIQHVPVPEQSVTQFIKPNSQQINKASLVDSHKPTTDLGLYGKFADSHYTIYPNSKITENSPTKTKSSFLTGMTKDKLNQALYVPMYSMIKNSQLPKLPSLIKLDTPLNAQNIENIPKTGANIIQNNPKPNSNTQIPKTDKSPLLKNIFLGSTAMSPMYYAMLKMEQKNKLDKANQQFKVMGNPQSETGYNNFKSMQQSIRTHVISQFDLSKEIKMVNAHATGPLALRKFPTLLTMTDNYERFSDFQNTHNFMLEKKVPYSPELTAYAKVQTEEYQDEEKAKTEILRTIVIRNKYLSEEDPITRFRFIIPNKIDEKILSGMNMLAGFKSSNKAQYLIQLENQMTATPSFFDQDILMDLPMYNLVLNIEERCIDNFAVEICDEISSEIHQAYTKFGPIVSRDFQIIKVFVEAIIKNKHPEIYRVFLRDNLLADFSDLSQHMYNRMEFILFSYEAQNY